MPFSFFQFQILSIIHSGGIREGSFWERGFLHTFTDPTGGDSGGKRGSVSTMAPSVTRGQLHDPLFLASSTGRERERRKRVSKWVKSSCWFFLDSFCRCCQRFTNGSANVLKNDVCCAWNINRSVLSQGQDSSNGYMKRNSLFCFMFLSFDFKFWCNERSGVLKI